MADNYNLVDDMLNDMHQNNPSNVLNYQPMSGGGGGGSMMGRGDTMGNPAQLGQMGQMGRSPIQQQQQVRMGEVDYIPRDQMQAPTMHNNMQQNMSDEQMVAPNMMMDDADDVMESPDLSNYGMDEDNGGLVDTIIGELTTPLIVAVLAFILSLPQVNGLARNMMSRVTTNPMYVNAVLALLLGLAVWLVTKFLS